MRAGASLGLWFYYARGCSDLAWDAGRTMLVRNRYHLALELQRLVFGGSPEASAARVAADLRRSSPKWTAALLGRAHGSGHRMMQSYYHGTCISRKGCTGRNVSLEQLVLDAASGMNDRYNLSTGQRLVSGCHIGPTWGSLRACTGMCAVRAHALSYVLSQDAAAMDTLNHGLLVRLCSTAAQLDSVQLSNQPQGAAGARPRLC